MIRKSLLAATALVALGGASASSAPSLQLGKLARVATVDARYQGYNIEMVEVTGGRFWAPYGGPATERYRQRPPIDLTDPKLIALAKGLGPSLLRVSGTWANNTYLEAPGEQLSAPPPGFVQVLTREQWKHVVAFSKAVDAPIVTSFAVSNGSRGADGVAVMALNTGEAPQLLSLGGKGLSWTMTGQPVETRNVLINGNAPGLDAQGKLTGLGGTAVAGDVMVPGQAVAFYAVSGANNPACR